MANIFNKPNKVNSGGFSIDSARLEFPALGTQTAGLLIQGIQIQYQQQVNFIYDLQNPDNVYYVAGRADGSLNMNKVVGSGGVLKDFYTKYGNVCDSSTGEAKTIQLTFNTSCTSGTSNTGFGNAVVKIGNPIILSFGLQMQVDQGVISENVAMRFSDLELP